MTKKLLGEERRTKILSLLQQATTPLTGADLAKFANVSRQVIVNDITLLKARNAPILATSQGYLYLTQAQPNYATRVVACKHTPAQAQEELFAIVDCGVTVKDVCVEHSVYGEITAAIHVSNRVEVSRFIDKVQAANASYLSDLTDGIHLHTLQAPTEDMLDCAEQALRAKGILLD